MVRRIRSTLTDNSALPAIIYTNTDQPQANNPSNILTQLTTKQVTNLIKPATSVIQVVTSTNGWRSPATSYLFKCSASLTKAPVGRPVVLNLRQRYAGSNTSANDVSIATISIASGTTSNTINLNSYFSTGDLLFVDVTQVGNTQPGYGLTIYHSYY